MRRITAAALVVAAALAPSAHSAPPVAFSAGFGARARLGRSAPLHLRLHLDVSRLRAPVTDLRILMPRGLDLATSGLGLADCRIPATDFASVIFPGDLPRCPPNSLLGTGTVGAAIWLDRDDRISASGAISLFAASEQAGAPGVTALVVARNPVRAQLAYAGGLFAARSSFGVGIEIAVPPIPHPPLDAAIGLQDIRFTIGGSGLRYLGPRRRHYRPRGLVLPTRCPRHGFPFRADLRFADGTRRVASARAPCPGRTR